MTATRNYLALDLGAESGRAILGRFDGERLAISELHRFPNGPVRLNDGLHWDVLRLWQEIKNGLALAGRGTEGGGHGPLSSAGLDAWGVDFALLDRRGSLVANPFHYRDGRTDGMLDVAFGRVPREEIFAQTGIQFMQINTLFQLLSLVVDDSPALQIAATFLTMPDLFNYWLTGRAVCEFSNTTTTQCYDPRRRTWATSLLAALDIPRHIFGEIVPPGALLGPLAPAVAGELGASGLQVVAPACHDTGSAVAAVPARGEDFAWISSGTWSVMGTLSPEPVIDDRSLLYNFTNEGAAGGAFRFSKNIIGLWLVQECRRTWAGQGEELSYAALTEMAARAPAFRSVIDPDAGDFLKPGDMPSRIQAFCRRTGQPVPEDKGAIVRCALEGLALKYRWVLERMEEITGRRFSVLHIVGGGTQNRLLSQFAADATGRPVVTGPIEATATGNILLQALALGHLGSLDEVRAVVRNSFEVETFEPGNRAGWDEAYERLQGLS